MKTQELARLEALEKQTDELSKISERVKNVQDSLASLSGHVQADVVDTLLADTVSLGAELVDVDNSIKQLYEKKAHVSKVISGLEVDIKIIEASACSSDEFVYLKNAEQRNSYRRLASESERRQLAEYQGMLEAVNGEISAEYAKKNSRMLYMTSLHKRLELISAILGVVK